MRATIVALSIRILAAALVAAAATPVYAQDNRVIATVPFDFIVGAQHLPAGKYIVRSASEDPSVIVIESADGHKNAVTLTIPATEPGNAAQTSSEPRLTFETRGAEHVLARVVESDGTEREIIRSHSSAEHATTAAEPDR